jgi:hypothetical protein
MVTGVEDVANNRLSLYLDGQLVRTGSRSGSAYQYNADRIQIGAEKLSSNRYFKGDIGISSLYNRALSTQEISRLYDFAKERYLSTPSIYADAWITWEANGPTVNTTILNDVDNTNSGSWSTSGAVSTVYTSSADYSANRISLINNRICRGYRSIVLNHQILGQVNAYYTYTFPASNRVSISMYTRFCATGAYNGLAYGYFGSDSISHVRPANPDIYYLCDIVARPNTFYRLDMLFVRGEGYYRELYDITGSFIGRSFLSRPTDTTVSTFGMGWGNARQNYNPSGAYAFDNVIIDWTTARFPSLR